MTRFEPLEYFIENVNSMRLSLNGIQPALELLEKKIRGEFSAYGNLASEMAHYAAGGRGKRLRPTLLFLSGKLFGEIDSRHVDAAAGIELIHTATLVHDDIIDEAQIRRKKPSLNKAYGQELAVMTGDLILSHAMNLLVHLPTPRAARIVTGVAKRVCEGEILQTFKRFHLGISEEEYFEVIEKKTATLFDASCRLGAELSGAAEEEAALLGEFGLGVGLAFQIVDDCLDIVGDENELGKSLGTDMKKGKLTLPFIRLLARLPKNEKKELEARMAPPLTPEKMRQLQEVLIEKEAVGEAAGAAADLVEKAKNSLKTLKRFDSHALETLIQFADSILIPLREKLPVLP